MSTWNDIINGAFVDAGVTQVGETLSSGVLTDAQARFNQFLSSLNTEGLTVFNQSMQPFALSAGTTAYTLGVGGSFSTSSRAQKVTAWRAYYGGVLHSGGQVLSMSEFGQVAQQKEGEATAIPRAVGADTAYPLINVRVFPPPSNTPGTLELAFWTPIAQVTDFTLTVSLPEGWPEMLRSNFAIKVFTAYPREGGIPAELAAAASNSKQALVSQNTMGAAQQQTPGK